MHFLFIFLILISFCHCTKWIPAQIRNSSMIGDLSIVSEGISSNLLSLNFYLNSKTVIYQTDSKLNILKRNNNFIPSNLYNLGYHHCGDIDTWEDKGVLLVPCSCYPNKNPAPFIAMMNMTTLNFTSNIVHVDDQGDCPWVAVDREKKLVYTSDFWEINTIRVMDEHLNFVKNLKLSKSLDQLQGGCVFNDKLYVGSNKNDTIYEIDTETGNVDIVIVQHPNEKDVHEMEGITFLDLSHLGMGQMHFFENKWKPKVIFHYEKISD